MGKMVGVAEFGARCHELLREMAEDGEPITLTDDGRVVGVVNLPAGANGAEEAAKRHDLFGFMRGTVSFAPDFDPGEPACDPDEWEAARTGEPRP